MGKHTIPFLVAAFSLAGFAVAAEVPSPNTAPSQTVTTTSTAPSAGGIIGAFDFRPTYKATVGSFSTEDYAQIGYRFEGGNSLTYRQEFMTNLYEPNLSPGLNAQAMDGSFRLKVNNILQDKAAGLSFSWEPRLYLPTNTVKRDGGLLTGVRSYLKFRKQFTPTSYLQLSTSPVFHFYSKQGYQLGSKLIANPDIETRVVVEAEFELFITGLALYLPVELQSVHYREFNAKAAFNGAWGHRVTFWPEITYPVAKTVKLGVAYRTDNLVKADLSGVTLSDAFTKGVPQFVLNASL